MGPVAGRRPSWQAMLAGPPLNSSARTDLLMGMAQLPLSKLLETFPGQATLQWEVGGAGKQAPGRSGEDDGLLQSPHGVSQAFSRHTMSLLLCR